MKSGYRPVAIEELLVAGEKILYRARVDELKAYEGLSIIPLVSGSDPYFFLKNLEVVLTNKRLVFFQSTADGATLLREFSKERGKAVVASRIGHLVQYFYLPLSDVARMGIRSFRGVEKMFYLSHLRKLSYPLLSLGVVLAALGASLLLLVFTPIYSMLIEHLLAQSYAIAIGSALLALGVIVGVLSRRRYMTVERSESREVDSVALAITTYPPLKQGFSSNDGASRESYEEESGTTRGVPITMVLESYGDRAKELLELAIALNKAAKP